MPKKIKVKGFVPVPTVGGESLVVPAGAVFKVNKKGGLYDPKPDIVHLGKKTDFLLLLNTGVVVVLLVGFASVLATIFGVLTDTWRYNITSYIDYQKSQIENVENIEHLKSEIEKLSTAVEQYNNLQATLSISTESIKQIQVDIRGLSQNVLGLQKAKQTP